MFFIFFVIYIIGEGKGILDSIDKRMEEVFSEMEALWYANDMEHRATKFGMDARMDALDEANRYRKGVIGDIDEWHRFSRHEGVGWNCCV